MKKLIIAATMFVSLSAFAGREKVNEKVLSAFNTEFANAQEVEWTISAGYFKASFGMNGQRVFAFYNKDGDLMGLTRNIPSSQLPVRLQAGLNKNYKSFWISDLFEVSNTDGTSYYVTLENGDNKIVLKSSAGNDWSTYKKDRKI
ncbi:MAG: hypothetical protein JWM28_785 [Chitinophagaceae bacterium]|nr:hypothetical protein [Chitinophagaceae bacterium]